MEVEAFEFGFDPSPLVVPTGTVTLRLVNKGRGLHNLVVEELGKGIRVIGPGESEVLSLTLRPGCYTVFCAVRAYFPHFTDGISHQGPCRFL